MVRCGKCSGFSVRDNLIITNAHVVESNEYVSVKLYDGSSIMGRVIKSDADKDLALIEINSLIKPLEFAENGGSIGQEVYAVGAPRDMPFTMTKGIISALDRQIGQNSYIQLDASVNNGNSGGPLINSFGEVIGITNAKIVTSTSESLGFAIPVNSVKKIIESIINYGKVVGRPYLGVSLQYVADDSYFGARGGVYVAEIVKNGPADKAGFELGDKVIRFDGVEIKETGDIIRVRDSHKVGDTVEVVVERDGKEVTLNMAIGDSADY